MEKYKFDDAILSVEIYWKEAFKDYKMSEQSIMQQAFYGGQQTAYGMIISHLKSVNGTEKK